MIQLVVIADDLTGACDTGVKFAAKGVSTLVTVDLAIGFLLPDATVLVVDTETRHLSPEEAAARVKQVAVRAREAGVRAFYKKTDSTLRGNVGAELEALMSAVGTKRLAFIPAYPKTGRTTRGGVQYIDGVPLEKTAFAADPLEPTTESFIPSILARQTRVQTVVVSPRDERAAERFGGLEKGIVVFDCRDDRDLARIARLLKANDALHLAAGPAGFAEVLPEYLGLPRTAPLEREVEGPVLTVCGSVNDVSLRQVAFAARHGVAEIVLPDAVICSDEAGLAEDGKALADKAASIGEEGRDVIVVPQRPSVERGEQTSCTFNKERSRLAGANLARFAAYVLEKAHFGACAVFGGDTALAVLHALGCTAVAPRDEIAAGVVVSDLAGSAGHFAFVTKAGGFGDADVLLRIAGYFRGANPSRQ